MKKFLFILISVLFLLGCKETPEEQIEKSFYLQSGPFRNIEIKDLKIYDTITVDEVNLKIDTLEKRIQNFEEQIHKFELFQDSVRKLNIPDSLKRPHFEKNNERRMDFDQRRDYSITTQSYARMLDMQRKGDIAAYYVEITTNYDTMHFAVTPITYMIICPVYMLE